MVVTFYSFKGGVGRSMALANIARWFQRCGLDVVVIDWDLEAPGIESFFAGVDPAAARAADQLGLIDLLTQYRQLHANLPFAAADSATEPQARRAADLAVLREHLPPIDHALIDIAGRGAGRLRLLSAGWRAGERFTHYANAVQAFDWNAFYAESHGHAYFDWLRESLCRPGLADIVLVDSRTGLTEMGGVCTRQMADVVVVLAAPNRQNLDGAVRMADSFRRPEVLAERDGRRLDLVMVPSRVDVASSEVKIAFERDFTQQTRQFLPTELERLRRDFWSLRIPYVSKYAFLEQLAIGEDDGDPDLQDAFKLIAAHLAWLAPEQGRVRSLMRGEMDKVFGSAETRVFVAPGRLLTRAIDGLAADEQPLARRVLLRMVTVAPADVGARDTPRLVAIEPFDAQHQAVLRQLTALGIVRAAPNSPQLVGLAQEEFLASPEFGAWLTSDREFLLWRQRLRTYIEGWEADGRQDSALLRGGALEQALRWLETRPAADFWLDERAFIEASRRLAATATAPPSTSRSALRPPAQVFICFRRHDSQAEAVLIHDHLRRALGDDRVFIDVAGLRPGDDFRQVIAERLAGAALMVVLIGPGWNSEGRAGEAQDFVNIEIALALQAQLPLLPVLVRGATMPASQEMAPEIRELANFNAMQLTLDYNAEEQLARLVGTVRHLAAERATPPSGGIGLLTTLWSMLSRWR